MRSFSAILGSITVPVVYATMRESGYPILIAAFSAALILFGMSYVWRLFNAHRRQRSHHPDPTDPA